MENLNLYLNNLTAKDEIKAVDAAKFLVENSSVELFEKLVEKSDYLFDFVRNNVVKRIEKAVNKNNFMNIVKFFGVYSPYYDDLFASILAKHANQDLTDEIFELLEKGTVAQKTYAAKYFCYIPDTVALELLSRYAFDDDESLSYNAAEALGQMQDDVSYETALSYLKSNDDFDKLRAVKFFNAYGKNYPLDIIFEEMKKSAMPENIAGQIPYMASLIELLDSNNNKYNALCTVDYILLGLGEILPLCDIFQFELLEVLEYLININKKENDLKGIISEILLKAFAKFTMFTENQEYIFDEDKNTKNEINSIFQLLQNQPDDFWLKQKEYIVQELSSSKERILSTLPVIVEFGIVNASEKIREIVSISQDEVILCECLTALNSLKTLTRDDIELAIEKVVNPNIKAIIDSLKA